MSQIAKRGVYDPHEPSMLADAFEAEAYRQGRIDGLGGRPPELFGATQYHMAAYRRGYNDGEDERGPGIVAWIWIVPALVVVTASIGFALWLLATTEAIWRP